MLFIRSGKGSQKTDDEIIEDYRKRRDPLCIEMLFDRYSHLVFAVSMKYLKDEEESKDVVLVIFEKLPGDILKYKIQNFSSWLHSVTKNYCIRVLSKKKYTAGYTDRIPDTSMEEEDDFISNYLPHLNAAISKLSEEQKICIDLFYIQNLTYQEVSDKSGYNMNQVKSYIQNGKRNLKNILLNKSNEEI